MQFLQIPFMIFAITVVFLLCLLCFYLTVTVLLWGALTWIEFETHYLILLPRSKLRLNIEVLFYN